MPVVWITGSPGTGKSRVLEALVARGFIAFDADKGIARWRDRSSGEAVWAPPARTRPATWHRDFTRRLERDRVQEIIENAGDSIASLCGVVENDAELWDLFAKVVYLVLDEAPLRDRLLARTTNDYGKEPSQLVGTLRRNASFEAKYRSIGAVMLDASQTVDSVVESILATSRELAP
jgi:dephospho-CoA kinase